MARLQKSVFISYRRKDISWALAVYQYLTSRNYDVFFDYESIYSGDFEQVIISNIKARAHFVLILTSTALDRCSDPADWLRREIETAVDEKRNIIPLFFDGFSFGLPAVEEKLTGKIAAIKRYNGLDIPSGYFMEAMVRLSERYLNVPLDSVIHPISTEVRRVVQDVQMAANNALIEKSDDIRELVKSAEEKLIGSTQAETVVAPLPPADGAVRKDLRRASLRLYAIGSALSLFVILGLGANALLQRNAQKIELTMTSLVVPLSGGLSLDSPVETATLQATPVQMEAVPAEEPTLTITLLPTIGAGNTKVSSADGETLIFIPPGTFVMGLTQEQTNLLRQLCGDASCEELYQVSGPAHQVQLTKGYWIYRTEVSNAQYAMCADSGNCSPPRLSATDEESYYHNPTFREFPVGGIDWDRADVYCRWAGGRLPTSAEWEYAARKDNGRLFPWGNETPDRTRANVNGLYGQLTGVNDLAGYPSPFGLLNMTGNVWEWVSDWYDPTYYSTTTDWVDPKGPAEGTLKVGRGGAWWVPSALSSIAIQDWEVPSAVESDYNYDSVGFRCARSE